jgi:hypothetical protein
MTDFLTKSFCGSCTGPDATRGMFHVFSKRVPLAIANKNEYKKCKVGRFEAGG